MATEVIQEGAGSGIVNEIWSKFQKSDSVTNEWSSRRDEILKEQLNNIRNEKKKRKLVEEEEVEQLLTRKLPFEYLARDWFDEQKVSLEDRTYMLEKLIPTLVMGVEKLLVEAEKRNLIEEKDKKDQSFNPINFLAQYLMRNNPRYSNFANASPYAKSICTMLQKLKEDAYELGVNNRLAELKEKVKKHRDEINEQQRKKQWLSKSRPKILQDMFVDWAGVRNSVISLSLVQSALRSFQDFAISMPIESQRGSMFTLEVVETDQTGKLINIREFVEYLLKHLQHLSEDSFNAFIQHMASLAVEYRASIELEGLRTIISNLFILCDFGETGLVDRQRILKLLNMFFEETEDHEIKSSLRDPRKWPVVEFEEEEDEIEKYIVENHLNEDVSNEEALGETESNGEALNEEASKEEALSESESNEEALDKKASYEEASDEEAAANEETSNEETSNEETSNENTLVDKTVSEETPTEENGSGDFPPKEEENEISAGRGDVESKVLPSEGDVNPEIKLADGVISSEDKPQKDGAIPLEAQPIGNYKDTESTKPAEIANFGPDDAEAKIEAYVSGIANTDLTKIDDEGNAHFTSKSEASIEADVKAIMDSASKISVDADSIPGVTRPFSVGVAHSFNLTTLTQSQFVNLLMTFLGDVPRRKAVEALVRFVRTGYVETEEERAKRIDKSKKDAESIKRRVQTEQLFDIWDVDGSGYLEINEVEMVLSKWREEDIHDYLLKEACDVFEDVFTKITRKSFKKLIDKICSVFPDEDVFDSLIQFLTRSVQRSFEERKRGDYRKKWLQSIDFSSRTSGGLLEPLFKATFQVISLDAQKHGKDKKVSAYVAMLEINKSKISTVKGDTVLRYVACTPTDTDLVLNKILHRGMKCISFVAVDSGKPIHVPRVLNHCSVHLWNALRREEKVEGSFICLPLKDYEKKVIGVLGIDTLIDPHDKSHFVQHEISFYQGITKALSNGLQYIDSRQNTIKIAESAVSWILRRSPNVQDVVIYLVEPSLKQSDGGTGTVLRKMVTLGHDSYLKMDVPPRLERKDNLFRDYLFKCIDTSETLTADAYGERHLSFPLRDSEGLVIIIVDISIGKLKQLPTHELSEVHRMLKLLEMAHKEISCEVAGEDKNMVLEVEKEHQTNRIEVLFDRIMLQDLRANVGRLDARAFAEIKSYKDPPKIIHDILNSVLGLYLNEANDDEVMMKLEEWTGAKQLINPDLIRWITNFDPTAGDMEKGAARLSHYLKNILPGAVGKHGSLPAQYLFNWAFVCMSLIEHTSKMRALRAVQTDNEARRKESNINVSEHVERKRRKSIVEIDTSRM